VASLGYLAKRLNALAPKTGPAPHPIEGMLGPERFWYTYHNGAENSIELIRRGSDGGWTKLAIT
jgi:hypothetical protein